MSDIAARPMRRHWLPVAALLAVTVLVLAGCGGSPSSAGTGGSTDSSSAVAFSACMRSHGLAEFPDPDSHGNLPKVTPQQLGVGESRFQSVENVCAHLLQPSTVGARNTLNGMVAFARCMRSHAIRNWPDPTFDSNGQPVFDLRGQVNPNARPASGTADECSHLLHPPPGQDGVVLCNGIGEAGCHHYGRPAG
jgi:hypothetical protein